MPNVEEEILLEIVGDPLRTRTPNLLIRSQLLYPVELRDRLALFCCKISDSSST